MILCRSADRRAKEQATHDEFSRRIETALERLPFALAQPPSDLASARGPRSSPCPRLLSCLRAVEEPRDVAAARRPWKFAAFGCVSSEGWHVQQEKGLPGQESEADFEAYRQRLPREDQGNEFRLMRCGSQSLGQIVWVPTSDFPSQLDSSLVLDGAREIDGEVSDDGHVFGAVAGSQT